MDQTIGIAYGVEGVGEVEKANNRVVTSFERVVSKIGNMTGQVERFGAAVAGAQKSMSGMAGMSMSSWTEGSRTLKTAANRATTFKDALIGLPRQAYNGSAAIDKLTGSIAGYVAEMKQAVGLTRSFGTGINSAAAPGKSAGGRAGRNIKSDRELTWLVPRFMFAWRAGTGAIGAAHYATADILLGKSREGLSKGLGELSAVGMNSDQKAQMEFNAKQFSQKFWTVSAEKYIEALSYTGSGFNINEIGAQNLTKLHEASMKMSMVAKMSAEKSAALISKSVLAIISQLPAEIADKLRSGEAAEVPHMGKVNIGELGEKLTAQYTKAMKTTMMWGPDIQNAFKYALPNFLEAGWSPAGALAFTGSLSNAGFHAGQSGRGIKDIFVREEETFAKIFLKGMGQWREEGRFDSKTGMEIDAQTRAMNRNYNEKALEIARGVVHEKMKTPEGASEMLSRAGEIYRKLTDPAQGGKETAKTLGVSTQFQPLFLTYTKKSFEDEMVKAKERIESASYKDLDEIVIKSLEDAGSAYGRIMNAFQNLSTSLANYPGAHWIASGVTKQLDYSRTLVDLQRKAIAEHWDNAKVNEWIDKNDQFLMELFGQKRLDILRYETQRAAKTGNVRWFWPTAGSYAQTAIGYMLPWNWGDQQEEENRLSPLNALWKGLTFQGGAGFKGLETYMNFLNGADEIGWEIGKSITGIWDSISAFNDQKGAEFNQACSDLWDSMIDPVKKAIAYIEKIGDWFVGGKGEAPAPPIPQTQEGLPSPFQQPVEPEFNPFRFGSYTPAQQPIQIQLASQPLQIDNRMVIDGRVLAQAVAEIIQQNRDVYYHGFGSDPTGFQVI